MAMRSAEQLPEPTNQPEQDEPALHIIDTAADIAKAFVGITDQDEHAGYNDIQKKGAVLAREGDGHLGTQYTELANKAYYERLTRQRERYEPSKMHKALREERLRRNG